MSEDSKPGPKSSVSESEILQLFQENEDPVLSTAEVAEQLPLSRRSIYNRLVDLREKNEIDGKKIGGKNNIWWISDI